MEVLMTGRGGSGSWQVRGIQLGRAMGATVMPGAREFAGYDVGVLVKRPVPGSIHGIHSAGIPLVYDVVDAWPQPTGNEWDREKSIAWLRWMMREVRPSGIVAATYEMLQDCKEFGVPTLLLPHHARPGLRRNPIRDQVRTVGYEGAPHYIARWREHIERECTRRGWRFEMQPAELSDVDILVALRDEVGYAPRNWKSGVKLANAQGSGTPIVCCREAGYRETHSHGEQWADTPEQLSIAFDVLEPLAARRNAAAKLLAATPHLQTIADTYSTWLRSNFSAR